MKFIFAVLTFSFVGIAHAATWDTHIHVLGKPIEQAGQQQMHSHGGESDVIHFDQPFGAKEALKHLDEAGIDKGLIISSGYRNELRGKKDRVQFENDFAAEQVRKSGGRLQGLCGVHPLDSFALEELQRCYDMGLIGIKIHPVSQFLLVPGGGLTAPATLAKLMPLIQLTNQKGGILLFDGQFWTDKEIRDVSSLAFLNPKATFIYAHLLRAKFSAMDLIDVYRRYGNNNIYLDLSAIQFLFTKGPELKRINWYMKRYSDFVLFASDMPAKTKKETLTPQVTKRRLLRNGFRHRHLRKFLETNPEKIFSKVLK